MLQVDSLVEAVADSLPSQYYDASYDAARTVLVRILSLVGLGSAREQSVT
jgi:hypothetical protein